MSDSRPPFFPFNLGLHPRQRPEAEGYSSACSTRLTESQVAEGCKEDGFRVRARCTVDRRPAAAKDREEVYSCWWTGLLGGWIVLQLLRRGEDLKRIRILDIRPPKHLDLLEGKAKVVQFLQVHISDEIAVGAFYERHPSLIPLSAKVNIQGPENIINVCREVGMSVLDDPRHFVQVINNDDELIPKAHKDFFLNYGYTKREAEILVRGANDADGLRTGCLRPGNGILGAGGGMLCGGYLARKSNPTWIQNIVSLFTYVENCALAHLLYEQRLIESSKLGRQAFCIVHHGLPPTYGNVYTKLEVLDGEVSFPHLYAPRRLLIRVPLPHTPPLTCLQTHSLCYLRGKNLSSERQT
ncbi:hypothetical protein ARMSODRAFT_1085803 [Armillaria solidipes]|uniref:3-beta hydroxysteroid dehydrogenase/isomerase domain-containing protein n=1 Tax=Armillaria solidipes TaxID=1076256 RepID=A0A2H3BDJ9_9AGAR|nr:hypothetical protein ARMSODRAFT_1085803 [Armillaria solidipes]